MSFQFRNIEAILDRAALLWYNLGTVGNQADQTRSDKMPKKSTKFKAKPKTEAEMEKVEAERVAAHEQENPMQVAEQARDEVIDEVIDEVLAAIEEELTDENPRAEQMADAESDMEGDAAPMEGDEEDKVVNSIVKAKFKNKYIENAKAQGIKGKAARRSNWDWLSQMLATFCLSDKGKIDIGSFTDVLDANGVDHSKWTNKNRGWEGRFRMTGRVALQRIVANAGVIKWPGDLEATVAPPEFVEKYKTKA